MSTSIVVGMGFGDEGKGTVVDYLASKAHTKPLVVRFSGGAQAAHNVITEDGFHHTFSQFGSGTLRHSRTLLSRYTLVDPLRLYAESLHLTPQLGRDALELMAVDERAPLVTRLHQHVNHVLERRRGDARHGSTGLGMGMTELYRLEAGGFHPVVGDLEKPELLAQKLEHLYQWVGEQLQEEPSISLGDVTQELQDFGADGLFRILSASEAKQALWSTSELIFEGSQGILLDEWIGFHPHTTWSTITPDNAYSLMREAGLPSIAERIGVTRTYTTRHGAGPFPTEDNSLGFAEPHNGYGEFQGAWRTGTLDLTLLSYAAQALKPTTLAITHMDVVQEHVAARYDELLDFRGNITHAQDKDWQEDFTTKLSAVRPELQAISSNGDVKRLIEEVTETQAKVLSYGPRSDEKVQL